MTSTKDPADPTTANWVDDAMIRHLDTAFADEWNVRLLSQHFRRNGYVKITDLIPDELVTAVRDDVNRLLDLHARRIDITVKETGSTWRRMSTVSQPTIATDSTLIPQIYESGVMLSALSRLALEPVLPCPWDEEKYVIIRQERKGDTHGWHWGDFSFTVIWIIEAPDSECGGALQCVPHTDWNKADPRLQDHLARYPINTYPHVTGDVYFLRSDTTLHRTVELSEDRTRIILNTCWASAQDTKKEQTHETMTAMFS